MTREIYISKQDTLADIVARFWHGETPSLSNEEAADEAIDGWNLYEAPDDPSRGTHQTFTREDLIRAFERVTPTTAD